MVANSGNSMILVTDMANCFNINIIAPESWCRSRYTGVSYHDAWIILRYLHDLREKEAKNLHRKVKIIGQIFQPRFGGFLAVKLRSYYQISELGRDQGIPANRPGAGTPFFYIFWSTFSVFLALSQGLQSLWDVPRKIIRVQKSRWRFLQNLKNFGWKTWKLFKILRFFTIFRI